MRANFLNQSVTAIKLLMKDENPHMIKQEIYTLQNLYQEATEQRIDEDDQKSWHIQIWQLIQTNYTLYNDVGMFWIIINFMFTDNNKYKSFH